MHLEFPADARVQIFIAPSTSPSFSDPTPIPAGPARATADRPRPRRRLLKGTAAVALLGGAYLLGGQSASNSPATPALAQAYPPAAAPAPASAERPGDMPPAFTQQLHGPATVTPPPGVPTPGSSPTNAFGLED